jgi:cell division septal protein FtsQ
MLKDDTVLVRVGADRFSERLQTYLDLLPAIQERIADIDYVDLRFDERVYVRPHGPGLRPRPGAPASRRRPQKSVGG